MNIDEKAINNFLDYLLNQKNFSKNTIRAYKTDLMEFNLYLSKNLNGSNIKNISLDNMHNYIQKLFKSKISEKSIHRKISSIKSLFKYFLNNKFINDNIMDFVQYPKISKKFLKEIGGEAWNDNRLKIHIDDGVQWVKKTRDNFYDVIFIDCSDPSEFSNLLFSDSFYEECKRILTPKGILATQSESPESFKNTHINILKTLKNIFKVSETMYSFVPIYPSGIWSWTFASSEDLDLSKKNYDEVAKIEKGCEIWNLNFQNAAFKMMPNKIVKELDS